ncbi:hypothetical protein C6C11_11630 [Aeromonas hydrophila]|uniref:Uncharacterized protein n=1 Tax=Aeromonas hydrophila TaxID=644 RepID=A0ABD7G770_AERHY|nr:hypothetical protein C6C11_11630 [Aeromonas hydrophila]
MVNRCRLIEAYTLQTDFEMRSCSSGRQGYIYSAIFVSVLALVLSSLPKRGAIQSQQQEDKQGVWIEPQRAIFNMMAEICGSKC